MKTTTTILLLFIVQITISQTKNIFVEYDYYNGYFTNKVTLIANNENAIKIKGAISITNNENVTLNEDESYSVVQKNVSIKGAKTYATIKNNTVKIKQPFKKEILFIKDSISNFNWELIPNKTKEILGYKCNLAKLHFRGRDYFAYYTTEIPIPFGPWKFKSLPGLILYIYSDTGVNKIKWTVSRIKYPYSQKINLKWNENLDTKLITYYDYIRKVHNKIKGDNQIISSRVKKGTNVTTSKPTRLGIELVYDWEK
ncbi:GLPGLI family protein [Tenacibaculum bernardetii]|uniref:GLPGLI family protein n=1 Tax=Tenacibaculum bernardetii TaxID=3021375 RepID=UPI0023B12156|nr:GLPGLI family protein [Tenacibaculum bernardetii]